MGKTVKCVRCGNQVAVDKGNTAPLGGPPAEPPSRHAAHSSEPAAKSVVAESARHIGELMVEDGLLANEQMQQAIAVREREGGQILPIILKLGFLDKLSLHEYLSRKPGIASIDLKSYYIPRELISLVPKEIAQECLVLPIDKLGRLLTVGMACPLDTDTVFRLEQITGLTVKPMLCKLDDILETIDRYYPGELLPPEPERAKPQRETEKPEAPALHRPEFTIEEPEQPVPATGDARLAPTSTLPVVPLRDEIRERFARMDALPTFTDTVKRVKERVDRGDTTARDLAQIIAVDPAIVLKLIGVANAAPYGMPGNVHDANLAAALLGTDGVCEVAMLSVIAANQYDAPPLEYGAYLNRACFCARAAKALAAQADLGSNYVAYTAGLLHSVGSLALACAFPKRASELGNGLTAFERITDETRLFGMGHPEAGGMLAKEWGIPDVIGEAIRVHRDLAAAAAAGPVSAVTAFATILADAYMLGESDPAQAIQEGEPLLKAIGITARDALHIFKDVHADMNDGVPPGQ
jgi:HD-like signal output (HDOD) protein